MMNINKRLSALEARTNPYVMEPVILELDPDNSDLLLGVSDCQETYMARREEETAEELAQRWKKEHYTVAFRRAGFIPILWPKYDSERSWARHQEKLSEKAATNA